MRAIRVGLAVLLVTAGGLAATRVFTGRAPATPAEAAAPSLAVATVTRADLANSRMMPGTLGYGTGVTVRGSGPGIVTQLPTVGATVRRGKPLFRVDDQPVLVLFGDTPLFRALDKTGLTGRDVAELRENLAMLGYASHRVRDNDVLDAGLLDAVHQWQPDVPISPARAVVLDGPGRVSALTAHSGDPAAGDLFTVTGTAKVVTVPVEPTDTVRPGAAVSVELPNGTTTPGVVSTISTVAGETQPGETPKLSVTIKLGKPADVAKLDAAAVRVRFADQVRKQVLTVPVGALVALREGGYAVQKRDGTLVPAKTGMFADGLVEVSGDALTEGLEVVTTP
ncbi:efflux RND transporter periplasmic adaptor subunit [Paractinoplanes durhamensis]|uniref:Peptidoglycan-binding protein n=1 Tax=Paractinoplanes durhamensis TaxID=113563 RepID=A0ABQ3YW12_9ACTN|nr:efflux RND transporter periplasmic adaptor subunit [Actinoplanes durhamensis]GIE01717.1 peptidoglycan-binding protein [Actinoplanes durhamensis]